MGQGIQSVPSTFPPLVKKVLHLLSKCQQQKYPSDSIFQLLMTLCCNSLSDDLV